MYDSFLTSKLTFDFGITMKTNYYTFYNVCFSWNKDSYFDNFLPLILCRVIISYHIDR